MTARRATPVLATTLLALLAGCVDGGPDAGSRAPVDAGSVPSTAAPVDGPAVRGTVLAADGSPVPGARVSVTLLRSREERAAIGIGAAASLGLSCLFQRGCRAPTADGVSAADGSYAVGMPRNSGDPPVGVAVSVIAAADDDVQNRVGTTVELPARAADGTRLDVPVATGPLEFRRTGTRLRVAMPPTEGAAARDATTVTLSQLPAEGEVAAATTDFSETPVGLPFDLRVAEDSRLLVVARQAARVRGWDAVLSATRVLDGDAVPASRGATCRVTDSRGKPRVQEACGLTDGVLGAPWEPEDDPRCADGPCPGRAQNDHRDTYVELADPVRARLLVVRGCAFTCTVRVSADGERFRELPAPGSGAGTDGFYVQTLSGAPVTVVHIRTATGGFFTKLREVSLFR